MLRYLLPLSLVVMTVPAQAAWLHECPAGTMPGGTIQAETGNVVAFQDSVQYSIERVGGLNAQTAMTAIFGGEGINLATFRGDGAVLLQSTSVHSLGEALKRVMHSADDRKGPLAGIGL